MEYDRAHDLDPSYYRGETFTSYESGSSGFPIGYLLAGFGIGFAAAMLLAPKSGTELRNQLNDGLRGGLDRLKNLVPEDLFRRAEDLGREAVDYVSERTSDLTPDRAPSGDDIADMLNNVSKDELIAVKGIGPVLADRIIRHRPYQSDREILDNDVLPESTFRALKQELLSRTA
jgi:gas vesicle protein